MSSNPVDRAPATDQLSLRAVLVNQGEDPAAALAEAGIIDAVAIPVVVGDDPNLHGGILGDGRTPNLVAVLETEPQDRPKAKRRGMTRSPPATARSAAPSTIVAPAAFGVRSLAPIRKLS
jgi:hypothetical protein